MCLGSASGILGLSLAATVATRWFNKKRGLVVGILTSGFAAGQLTFIPFMAGLLLNMTGDIVFYHHYLVLLLAQYYFFYLGKTGHLI